FVRNVEQLVTPVVQPLLSEARLDQSVGEVEVLRRISVDGVMEWRDVEEGGGRWEEEGVWVGDGGGWGEGWVGWCEEDDEVMM
uniref:hypothetical protein n=1 Tax=Kocuria rhizophila TaxID=72000 RepID=UPI001C930B98